jgi:SagB-type dehydrogenase family enzyme
MTVSYALACLDLLGIVGKAPTRHLDCSVLTSILDFQEFLAGQERAGRASCIISIADASLDADSVRLRTELNASVLRSGSLLVPCVFADQATVHVGPWVRGRSTPCLQCFSPQGLPSSTGTFRIDDLAGPDGIALLRDEPLPSPLSAAKDESSFASLVLEDVMGILLASLRRASAKSVWGRVIEYRLLGSGRVGVSSWRALKDPYCPCCAPLPEAVGRTEPAPRRLSRVLHENTKLHEHFCIQDAIDPAYLAADAPVPLAAPSVGPDAVQRVRPLPDARSMRTIPIEEAILRRRSRRKFSPGELSLDDLSALLYFGCGITKWAKTKDGNNVPLRAAPSGGALYPIDIYTSARRVSGLPHGVYRYDPLDHALLDIDGPLGRCETLSRHSAQKPTIDGAAAVFLLAATFERNQAKYLERGYRVVLLEAGHIAQNLHLIATARKLRSCCLTAFVDDRANDVLGLAAGSGTEVLYLVAVGR